MYCQASTVKGELLDRSCSMDESKRIPLDELDDDDSHDRETLTISRIALAKNRIELPDSAALNLLASDPPS